MTAESRDAELGPVAAEIVAHYESADEAGRLDTGLGRLERERTRRLVERFMSPPPGVVLDVGGGAGVHAIWLAGLGYEVHLSDPVARHVEQAKENAAESGSPLASAVVGHAGDLDHGDGTADAVLAFGPLYHLPDPADRSRALQEAARVLRAGGWFFGAAISRFTSLVNALREGLLDDTTFLSIVDGDLDTGHHRNPSPDRDFFTTAYVHRPDELATEVGAAGFDDVQIIAVEGVAWAVDDFDARWADRRSRDELLRLVERTETEPALLGASTHLLAVGRKPQ
ncbi:MAG: class I SAM-dependent methyltransferase [Acidimicrobiia bacterium]|nr:class I SAM-dependent methyltransferase [Acidimicrobiia bacterium]